ncbi:MAG: TIGR03905 family TSCPD domain-containing protein [Lachnospiraceae bacterium]|nr:TIGR03905 family TSCPD domain-containing protein [Lachnospiraceae bacterium]
MYEYTTHGTCSKAILFDIEERDGKQYVRSVKFINGCSGNTQGVARLVEGMEVGEVIARLDGVKCGSRGTSCPDQLANALKQHLA